jgi:hypothetical protein
MREHENKLVFHSPLSELMLQLIHEKQACGYRYDIGIQALRRLDRFLCESGLESVELPREIVDRWTAKRSHERVGTQKSRIDRAAIREARRYDGKWVREANDDTIRLEDAAFGYKGLLVIARCFRSLKRTGAAGAATQNGMRVSVGSSLSVIPVSLPAPMPPGPES